MRKHIFISTLLLFFCNTIFAEIKLPKLISNGMVLQRNIALNIWGWAKENEAITLSFKNHIYKAITTKEGKWTIQLPKQKEGGPYQMIISGSNKILLNDILIGDVWVCSGQSNMELTMDRVKYKYSNEVKNANNSAIRQFLVPDKYDFNFLQNDFEAGEWLSVNKKNIGEFSAAAYFFAKNINEKYKVPVGLINAALGGSPAEAWISENALKKFPGYYAELQKFKSNTLINKIEAEDKLVSSKWYKKINEEDIGYKEEWKKNNFNDSNWKEMNVPGYWPNVDSKPSNGVVWFRKNFYASAAMINKPSKIELGRIVDADSVFINEIFVGNTTYLYPPRRYEFNSNILKQGENTIVIRVVNNSGNGGFVLDKKYELTMATDTIDLKGLWKYNTGAVAKALPGQTFVRWKPTGLYNAMIAPLHDYGIKGVLWYQGESNVSRPNDYKDLMQTLIEDWRLKWNQGDFPFISVQLANFMEASTGPKESSWAALRQQQLNTLSVKNTGMVVAIDAGDWNDIHPENKKTIGDRLALQAEHLAYKNKNTHSGPLFKSSKIIGSTIEITFTNTGSGLVINKGNELNQFTIAGDDNKFIQAQAIIKNNKIIVWNDALKNPVTVRYAWADNPLNANLYNKENLPASPFTTAKY